MSSEVVALASLGLTFMGLMAQAALAAFFLGKLSARIFSLEVRARDTEDSAAALAAITATLHALKESVDDIRVTFARRFEAVETTVKALMMGRPRRAATRVED